MSQKILELFFNGVLGGGIYTLIALGLTMIYGILELVNFAHGEIYMVGAYVAFYLSVKYNSGYFLALSVAMMFCAILGVLMERVAFRPLRRAPKLNPLISSLGISIFLQNIVILIWEATPRIFPTPYMNKIVKIGSIAFSWQRLIVLFVSISMIISLYIFIQKSLVGKAVRALSQDLEAASIMGINVDRIIMLTFAIGGGLAAASGALVGPIFVIDPFMGIMAVLKAFAVVILGGFGNIQGTILAGFLLGLVESYAVGFFSSAYRDSIAFVILIAVLLLRPTGLYREKVEENV